MSGKGGADATAFTVAALYRHPVKGLTPEALARIDLAPGQGVDGDRRFALLAAAGADVHSSAWVPKGRCLTLVSRPRLAGLRVRFVDARTRLVVDVPGRSPLELDPATVQGATAMGDLVAAHLGDKMPTPRLVEARGFAFTDTPEPLVSIVSLASLVALERAGGRRFDVRRFRANVVIDGPGAWRENGWVGAEIAMGGARLEVVEPIVRCAATNADPDGGRVDADIPALLGRAFGHRTFGVYAKVTAGGAVALGDRLEVPPFSPDDGAGISFYRDFGI